MATFIAYLFAVLLIAIPILLLMPQAVLNKISPDLTTKKVFLGGVTWLTMLVILFFVALAFEPEPKKPELPDLITEDSIKAMDESILEAQLVKQALGDQPDTYAVLLWISLDPFWGGADDWTRIAEEYAFKLGKPLIDHKNISHYSMFFKTKDDGLQWAHIKLAESDLPDHVSELSYHDYFSYTNATADLKQAYQWLCEYYSKYHFTNPNPNKPKHCQ